MIEPSIMVLSGIIVAFVSGILGKYIGSSNKVKEKHCDERRRSCVLLISEKIDNISNKIDEIKKVVDDKLLGI